MVSSQALLWVPYFIAVLMLESCSYVVHAQQSEYLLVPILMGCLAAIMSMYLLREDCTSPGGYAASISRVSGSIFFEGYVFMFVSLVTVAVYILGRINFIQDHKIQRLADKRPRKAGRLLKSGTMAVKAMKGRLTDRCCASDVARKRCDMVIRYAIILVCITAVVPCAEIKLIRRVRVESSRHPPRHRRDACSMAWRCRFLTARPSQNGRVIADALVDFHTGRTRPSG